MVVSGVEKHRISPAGSSETVFFIKCVKIILFIMMRML